MGLTVSTLLIKGRHQRTSAACAHTAILILKTKSYELNWKKKKKKRRSNSSILIADVVHPQSCLKVAFVAM